MFLAKNKPNKSGSVPNSKAFEMESKGGWILNLSGGAEYKTPTIKISNPVKNSRYPK